MDMNQSADCRITMPLAQRDMNTDISEDFTLAEHYPEIRKVLYLRTSLLPPAKFISGNKIDVNGVVDYTLVYISPDGRLCSAPLSAEYSFSLPVENMSDFEMNEGFSVMAHSANESSSVRVITPRKLQIRSHLKTSLCAWGKRLCSEKMSGIEDDGGVERLTGKVSSLEVFCESSDVISLSGEYRLPTEDCKISLANVGVVIGDARIEGDGVRAMGEVIVELLLAFGDGNTEKVVRRLPLDVSTDLDGVELSESGCTRVLGSVTDTSITVEEGEAHIDVSLVLELCCFGKQEISYTQDVYSVDQECRCEYKNYEVPTVICNKNVSFSQNDRIIPEEAGMPDGARIVDVNASAIVDSVEDSNGRYVLIGSCRYNIVYMREGEYGACELKLPIRYELDGTNEGGELHSFDVSAEISDLSVRSESEYFDIDSKISFTVTLFGKEKIRIVDCAEFGAPIEKRKNSFTVCYPTPDDSVWSIAKRYCVRQSDISGEPNVDGFVMIEVM